MSQLLEKAQGIYQNTTGCIQEEVEETDSEHEHCEDQNTDEDNTISVIESKCENGCTDTGIYSASFVMIYIFYT